jgi:hypothetical protein
MVKEIARKNCINAINLTFLQQLYLIITGMYNVFVDCVMNNYQYFFNL